MPVLNIPEFFASLRPNEALIGLDPGRARIGVAISDVSWRLANPYGVWPRDKLAAVAVRVRRLAEREQAGGLVVGFPLESDGRVGPAAQAARDWARDLSDATGLPAALWDERYSTVEAAERLDAAGVPHRDRAGAIDRVAAAVILQGLLDAHPGGRA